MDRGERRHRTLCYATRAHRVWLRAVPGSARPLGEFRKGKAMGCRCRRSMANSPKVPASCHQSEHHLHPSVVRRIEGKRLAQGWLKELRGHGDLIDVEL